MDRIIVKGGNELRGDVKISAAKNSVLPIIAASILGSELIALNNSPMLEDVYVICNVLSELGCNVSVNKVSNQITIDSSNVKPINASSELVRKMSRRLARCCGRIAARTCWCRLC